MSLGGINGGNMFDRNKRLVEARFGRLVIAVWAVWLSSVGSSVALAQTAASGAAAKPATTRAPVKPVVSKPAGATAAAKPAPSRVETHSKAEQMAAGVRAADAALTPEQLEIAQRVYTGHLPCELGASVQLDPDPRAPGYFNLQLRQQRYRLIPVATTTGAIRLEDERSGSVWLQLANKSMLMNQKQGRRLADECQSPQQVAVAQSFKDAPPPSILEPAPVGATAPASAGPSSSLASPSDAAPPVNKE